MPNIFPKLTTKKFIEVSTGEVLYVLKDINEVYYQKELYDQSKLVRLQDFREMNQVLQANYKDTQRNAQLPYG